VENLVRQDARLFQAMMEINAKLEGVQQESFNVENELNHVRSLLIEQERKRGRPYNERFSVVQQDLVTLVNTIQQSIKELSSDVEQKERSISKVSFPFIHLSLN
jgi:hypothetical protein